MKDISNFFIIIFIIVLILLGLNFVMGTHYKNTHPSKEQPQIKNMYQQHVKDNQRTKNMTREQAMEYYNMSVDERNKKYDN